MLEQRRMCQRYQQNDPKLHHSLVVGHLCSPSALKHKNIKSMMKSETETMLQAADTQETHSEEYDPHTTYGMFLWLLW